MAAPPRPYRFTMNALPWDVLFHIMLHAEIPDILSLRRTCRIFRDVSHSKAIWRHQLEQDASLPVPASVLCDLSDATLDAASLERTATASLRMTGSLLQKASLPEPHRIIHDAFTYTNMFAKLLPGGRYLVTGSLDSPGLSTASYVSLWDLDTAIEKAEPIASVRFEMPVIKCTFSTTKERDVIRLLVSSGHRFFGFEVHIIEVRWAPVPGEAPSFTKIATLPDIPVSPISLALDGDVAFFTTPQPVIVWNWRNDAMAAGMNVEGVSISAQIDILDYMKIAHMALTYISQYCLLITPLVPCPWFGAALSTCHPTTDH
ncbi:hypothetical protein DL93DRAFT_1119701 [Clavulina sp. PMI_390]|nr:hypothetical protein DL93DRAFT_1119701 [Clavulina sp. PMI_390]